MNNRENFKDLFERLEESKKTYQNNDGLSFNIDKDKITEELKKEFENVGKIDINDESNVFLKCKISKEDSQRGVEQWVKYKSINENGEKVERKVFIKIPSGIESGSQIVCYSEGNYIKEKGIYSNLIVNIEVK